MHKRKINSDNESEEEYYICKKPCRDGGSSRIKNIHSFLSVDSGSSDEEDVDTTVVSSSRSNLNKSDSVNNHLSSEKINKSDSKSNQKSNLYVSWSSSDDDDGDSESLLPNTSNNVPVVSRDTGMRKQQANHIVANVQSTKNGNYGNDVEADDVEDDAIDENFNASENSDSDDEQVTTYATRDNQTKLLEFFKNSSHEELATMSHCSAKTAHIIVGLRPFKSWNDLNTKLESIKKLGKSNINASILLHACVELLKERRILCGLMKKCDAISNRFKSEFDRLKDSRNKLSAKDLIVQVQPQNIPKDLQLKPYQLIGLNWMATLLRHGVNGILADEMGLGKTIQTICFFAYLLESGLSSGPHLVIVPSSTLDNWTRELSQWCSSLQVVIYSGSMDERRYLRNTLLKKGVHCNVILTTYHQAIRTADDRALFKRLGVHFAVFDEGHMLKNMSTQRYQHLMRIRAEHRLLLTGTPLQNNLLELMSLLRFVMPHMFEETTSSLIRLFTHSHKDDDSNFAKQRINHAKSIMQPFVLRRLKNDVLSELPTKIETVEHCQLTESQRVLYDKTKGLYRTKEMRDNLPKNELKSVVIELRKVANHALLRRVHYPDTKLRRMATLLKKDVTYVDSNETYLFEDMQVMSDFELHNLCCGNHAIQSFKLSDAILLESGKFQQLDKMLPAFETEGKRVLLFTQFTMMLDIIEVYLKLRNKKYLRMDGQTPVSERLALIDTFNTDMSYTLFILSTKAGGLGINLTSASVVIIHDIDFNPYNDKQAEDRCHRLGQTKPVHVIRLLAKDTIEEHMYQTAQYKLRLEKEMTDKNDEEYLDMVSLIKDNLL